MPRPRALTLLALPLGLCAAACRKSAPAEPAAAPPPPAATAPSDAAAVVPAALADALRHAGRSPAEATVWFGAGARTVFRVRTPGARAVALWEAMRDAVDRTGHWPVIVGTDEDAGTLEDTRSMSEDRDPDAVLAAARGLDADAWLAEKRKSDPEAFAAEEGEWPEKLAANTSYAVVTDLKSGKPHAQVWLALVPTRESCDVPAFLPFGDWNDCPPDHVHVALLRRWRERYGAELVCLSNDTMELRVARRPASREEAERLARDQYVYCADAVDQGVGTLRNLAADRRSSPVWFFWWD